MRKFVNILAVLLCLVGWIALPAWSADQSNKSNQMQPGELFVAGSKAYQAGHYSEAVGYLSRYLEARGASVGDPRLADAQKMFTDSALKVAREQVQHHNQAAAASFLVEQAGRPGVGDGAAELKTEARKDLQLAEAEAERKSDHQQVLEVAELWTHLFPDEPPMIDQEKLNQYRLAALVQLAKTGEPESALRMVRQVEADGVSDQAIAAAGVHPTDLTIKYAQSLMERGWYRQAAAECQQLATGDAPSAQQTTQAHRLIERSLAMYMEACQKFGNPKMIEQAADLYAADSNPQREPIKAKRYQTAAASLKGKDEPESLTISGNFAEGKGVWTANGVGYTLKKEIEVGNNSGNRGGKSAHGEIDVGPGFVLDGGTVTASNGTLKFEGTPDKPIILHNVNLQCELTGTVSATNTIFIDCSFHKTGAYYWFGGYSSHWDFTDCMVVHSQFAGLTRVDYGIKWNATIFVDCNLPDRILNDDPSKDAVREYHGDQGKMTNCFFYDCTMAPSVLWGGMPAICYGCEVAGTSRFTSTTSLAVPVALPPGDGGFLSRLMMSTTTGGPGALTYTSGPPPQVKPSPLWKFVPEISDSVK